MLQDRIAKRYAKSLFDLANEHNNVGSLMDELKSIENLYDDSPDFRAFLRSPVINFIKKAEIIEAIFQGKCQDMLLKFMVLLARKGRIAVLIWIIQEFRKLYNLKNNITDVLLVSAFPLSAETRQNLIKKVELDLKTKVETREKVNPDLIGGFQLKIGNTMYDGSIASALNKLQTSMLNQI